MRIAFILTEFPSLSETFILNQITGLLDLGHDVRIHAGRPLEIKAHPAYFDYKLADRVVYQTWVPRNPVKRWLKATWLVVRHLPAQPAAVLRCLLARSTLPNLLFEAAPYFGTGRYDAVVCHYGENGLRASALARLGVLGDNILTFFHGADITRYVEQNSPEVYRPLFQHGRRFLPISERWKQRLLSLGCPAERVAVHRMGIDCTRFEFTPRRAAITGTAKLVSVARLVEKKGLEYAIDAVSRLALPAGLQLHYEIIGDGPLLQALQARVDALDLQGRVKLSGWQDQAYVRAALADADLLLAPSVTAADGDQEGIPVALMEAMACGLPVISTRHSGIPELIEHGVTGMLVEERDTNALASTIADLLAEGAPRAAVALQARRQIETDWNIVVLNERLASICSGH